MIKRNIPKVRFKQFCDFWKTYKLGNLGSVAMNKRIFKEETSEVGEIPFYKIGTFGSEPNSFITREKFDEYKSKYPYPEIGDILISASGSIGRTVEYLGEEAYFQDSNIVWLKHDERLDNSFLKQFYSIVKWQGIEGTTIKRLYNKNILETQIALPSISEQSAIGSLFRTLDDLLDSYKDNLVNYQSLKATMLSKMFSKAGQTVPEIRLDGFEGEWRIIKLGDVLSELKSGLSRELSNDDIGLPVIRANNISDGILNLDRDIKYWFKEDPKGANTANYFVKENDILVNFINSEAKMGTAAIVLKEPDRETIYTTNILKLTVKEDYYPYFIYLMTFVQSYQNYIKSITKPAVNQASFTTVDFKKYDFLCPSFQEQQAIGSYFSNLDQLITSYQEKISQLETLKKKLLQDMFI